MRVVQIEAESIRGNDLGCEADVVAMLDVIDQRVVVLAIEFVGGHREIDPLWRASRWRAA